MEVEFMVALSDRKLSFPGSVLVVDDDPSIRRLIRRIRHLLHARETDKALRESYERFDEVQRIAGLGYWE